MRLLTALLLMILVVASFMVFLEVGVFIENKVKEFRFPLGSTWKIQQKGKGQRKFDFPIQLSHQHPLLVSNFQGDGGRVGEFSPVKSS